MKKILFVGDLRKVHNYGAIATTESLIKLFQTEIKDYEMKIIEARSMYEPTPAGGWTSEPAGEDPNSLTNRLKNTIRTILPFKVKSCIRALKKSNHVNLGRKDFVPYKFSQYEEYYSRIINGEKFQYEDKLLKWADIVYINSEGNIVNGTDELGRYRLGARYILFMAWLAKVKYNKTVIIANHTVDPKNMNAFEMIENIYPRLDYVILREPLSIALLEKHGVDNVIFAPDALFTYKDETEWTPSPQLKEKIDFSKPYICIGDSSAFQNKYGGLKWPVAQILTEIIMKLKELCPHH